MQQSDNLQDKSAISGVAVDQAKPPAFTHYSLRVRHWFTHHSFKSNSPLKYINYNNYALFQRFNMMVKCPLIIKELLKMFDFNI